MTNHDLQLRAGSNSTKLVIKADGKVGIGTLTPDFLLDVSDRYVCARGRFRRPVAVITPNQHPQQASRSAK